MVVSGVGCDSNGVAEDGVDHNQMADDGMKGVVAADKDLYELAWDLMIGNVEEVLTEVVNTLAGSILDDLIRVENRWAMRDMNHRRTAVIGNGYVSHWGIGTCKHMMEGNPHGSHHEKPCRLGSLGVRSIYRLANVGVGCVRSLRCG